MSDHHYFTNWTALTNSCVVVVKGPRSADAGTVLNCHNMRLVFANMRVFFLDGDDEQHKLVDIFRFLFQLSLEYKKIFFYYTGYGENISENQCPTFVFNSKVYKTHALHRHCEKLGFALSVIVVDTCHTLLKGAEESWFKLLSMLKDAVLEPLPETYLEELFNQHGHLLIASPTLGDFSYGNTIYGGSALSLALLYHLAGPRRSGFVCATGSARQNLETCGFPQPTMSGFATPVSKTARDDVHVNKFLSHTAAEKTKLVNIDYKTEAIDYYDHFAGDQAPQ